MYEPEQSQLYVISWASSQHVCKIGRTTNVSKRFNQFLTAHFEPLVVHCLCDESIMCESDLHERHASQCITLEHFNYTDDLKATVEMLNASTGFKPYTIPRTKRQTGTVDDVELVEQYKQELGIPPLRISALEKQVSILACIGMTVAETAQAMDLSEAAVKSHRHGVINKCFTPNLISAISKLFLHGVLKIDDLSLD